MTCYIEAKVRVRVIVPTCRLTSYTDISQLHHEGFERIVRHNCSTQVVYLYLKTTLPCRVNGPQLTTSHLITTSTPPSPPLIVRYIPLAQNSSHPKSHLVSSILSPVLYDHLRDSSLIIKLLPSTSPRLRRRLYSECHVWY